MNLNAREICLFHLHRAITSLGVSAQRHQRVAARSLLIFLVAVTAACFSAYAGRLPFTIAALFLGAVAQMHGHVRELMANDASDALAKLAALANTDSPFEPGAWLAKFAEAAGTRAAGRAALELLGVRRCECESCAALRAQR